MTRVRYFWAGLSRWNQAFVKFLYQRVLTVTTTLVPGLTQVTQAVDLVERGSVRLDA